NASAGEKKSVPLKDSRRESDMHVAVTGASAGIGEALVREYAARGARVTMIARRKDRLGSIAQEGGGETPASSAGLTDVEAAPTWIAEAERAFGAIDVLVNNAGVQIIGAAHEAQVAEGEAMLRLNLHTPLRLTRTVLPAMLARRSGTIVDIASMAALT